MWVANSRICLPLTSTLRAGRFGTDGKRQDERAKAMYANGDSFFGQYSADKRSGRGLYVFAKGGVHAGQRQQGGMPSQASRPVQAIFQ